MLLTYVGAAVVAVPDVEAEIVPVIGMGVAPAMPCTVTTLMFGVPAGPVGVPPPPETTPLIPTVMLAGTGSVTVAPLALVPVTMTDGPLPEVTTCADAAQGSASTSRAAMTLRMAPSPAK